MTARHKWDHVPTYRPAADCADGNERNERACQTCGLVKITVIPPISPPYPWREWRVPDGRVFKVGGTPPCTPTQSAEPVNMREAS